MSATIKGNKKEQKWESDVLDKARKFRDAVQDFQRTSKTVPGNSRDREASDDRAHVAKDELEQTVTGLPNWRVA